MRQACHDRSGSPTAVAPEEMAQWLLQLAPANDAEALKLLRSRFPDRPLTLRVAALGFAKAP